MTAEQRNKRITNDMKTLKCKLIIMTVLYLLCNFFIWFGLKPCLTLNKIHNSTFFPVTQNDVWFFPLCVLLPVLLFQPHMVILFIEKPLADKKQKKIYWLVSLGMAAVTITAWIILCKIYVYR